MQNWLEHNLSDTNRTLLAALPLAQTFEIAAGQQLYVCHASPRAIDDPICAPGTHPDIVRQAYGSTDATVFAFGHWHGAYSRWLDGRLYLNVASVGFRHNGLSYFTMLTYQEGTWVVEQQAIAYNLEAEAERVRRRQVPRPNP